MPKMKLRCLSVLAISCLFILSCQNQEEMVNTPEEEPIPTTPEKPWAWARTINGPSEEDEIDAVATDDEGNVYLSGKFEQSLSIEGHNEPLTSRGRADIMVAKYTRVGNLEWVRHFGSTSEDNIFDADCDRDGNLILSGYFGQTVDFGGITLSAQGNLDMVVLKMSPEGDVIWAKKFGSTEEDGGNEVEIGPQNEIIVGAGSKGNFESISATGLQDAYVVSLNPDGEINWIRTVQGPGIARAKAIEVDELGRVYLGGDYAGDNYFISNNQPISFPNYGNIDAYLISYSSNGDLRWWKTYGGPEDEICKGLINTSDNSLYLAGQFQNEVPFDGQVLNSMGGSRDIYLWKLDENGTSVWLRHIKSQQNLLGAELGIDDRDNVWFGMSTAGTVEFPENTINYRRVSDCQGDNCPVILSYSPTGELNALHHLEQSDDARFGEIAVSGNRVYLDCPFTENLTINDRLLSSQSDSKDGAIVAFDINP
ncbi:MAG: hypothetical protein AAGF87_13155 [Bacteroidota bacterium]